jgi:hypothetical protein
MEGQPMNASWEAIMETRVCLIQAMDQNHLIREDLARTMDTLAHNHGRLETAMARLDALVGAPAHAVAGGQAGE